MFFVSLTALIVLKLIIAKPFDSDDINEKNIFYKSLINKVNLKGETTYVNMALGQRKFIVKEEVTNMNIQVNFGNLIIDATNIKNDTKITINANCANVVVMLPDNMHVTDMCDFNFGSHKSNYKNTNGIELKLEGTLTLSSLQY